MMVHDFVARLKKYGLEWFGLYYGEYHGEVVEVMGGDPDDHLNRVKVRAPEVWPDDFANDDLPWAWPSYGPGGVNHGLVWTPKVGDAVYVRFHLGRRRAPKYTTTWWGKGEAPEGLGQERRGWRTPAGWRMVIDDEDNLREVKSPSGSVVWKFNDNGTATLVADNINLGSDAPTEFVALAQKVLNELNLVKADLAAQKVAHDGHIHITTATVGPGPALGVISPTVLQFPTPHSPQSVASSKVKAD